MLRIPHLEFDNTNSLCSSYVSSADKGGTFFLLTFVIFETFEACFLLGLQKSISALGTDLTFLDATDEGAVQLHSFEVHAISL